MTTVSISELPKTNLLEWNKLRKQRKAQEKYDYMLAFKKNLDNRIENLKREENDIKFKKKDYEKNHLEEIKQYKNEIDELKLSLNDTKKNNNEFKDNIVKNLSK